METRMELFARIRRDARSEEYSIRQLARRHQVGRATVRTALAQAEPLPKSSGALTRSVQSRDRRHTHRRYRRTTKTTPHGPPNPRQTGRRTWSAAMAVSPVTAGFAADTELPADFGVVQPLLGQLDVAGAFGCFPGCPGHLLRDSSGCQHNS